MFENIKRTIGEAAFRFGTQSIRKYDADWFVRFLKLADEEDSAGPRRVSDPMRQNAWVNLAVNAISQNFVRASMFIKSGDTPLTSGPVVDLFDSPNPFLSKSQLWEGTIAWKYARGEAFWIFEDGFQAVRMRGKLPTQIWLVDPNKMDHVLDAKGKTITMWVYTTTAGEKMTFLPEELIHHKLWNKWNQWRGVNPLIAMSEELTQDYLTNVTNTSVIDNGSTPGGVLSSKQRLTPKDAEDIQARWEKNHKGAGKIAKIAVLGQDTTYQQIALSPADMLQFDGKKWNRQTILATYRVPPAVVGVKDDLSPLSGTDTNEQMKMFWNMRLLPEIEACENQLQRDFFKRFGLALTAEFDVSSIQELQDDQEKQSRIELAEISAGRRTINQVRKAHNEDPVAWGDTWLVNPFMKPAEIVIEEANEPPESVPEQLQNPPVPPEEDPDEEEEDAHAGVRKVWDVLVPKPVELSVILPSARKTQWSKEMRDVQWKKLDARWNIVEGAFKKDLQAWLFRQRAALLLLVNEKRTAKKDALEDVNNGGFWAEQQKELKEIAQKHFIEAMELEGDELADLFKDMGESMAFDIYDTNALTKLQDRVNKGHLQDVTETIRGRLREIVGQGLEEGWTETQMNDAIRDVYNVARGNAQAVARTELGGIINDSRFEGFQSEGFSEHSWMSAQDEFVRTNPFNHMIDGELVKLGDTFSNGLRYPHDPLGEAGNVINCFLPGTKVSGKILIGLKSWYSGKAIEIVTRGGNRLSVTPNHPIFTSRGWARAADVREGDDLFCYSRDVKSARVTRSMDDEKAPPTVEQIFDALALHSSGMVSKADFHGDGIGCYGDIYVAGSAGELLFRADTASNKRFCDFVLEPPTQPLSGIGSRDKRSLSALPATSSLPRPRALTLDKTSISLHVRPFQALSFGSPPDGDASLDETAKQNYAVDPSFTLQLKSAFPGQIFLDDVVEVRHFETSGHIYDLQAKDGWIIAENIICGNCRCITLPEFKGG